MTGVQTCALPISKLKTALIAALKDTKGRAREQVDTWELMLSRLEEAESDESMERMFAAEREAYGKQPGALYVRFREDEEQ